MENDNENQENDNQQTGCSEHESSSGLISQTTWYILWRVKQVNFVIKFSTAQNI